MSYGGLDLKILAKNPSRSALTKRSALDMTDETVYLTTLDNAKTAVFGRGTLGKTSITFSLVAILGVILGVFIIYAGGLAYKWAFVIAIAGCFPLLVIAMGSLKRALEFCLILSLSMHLDIYPWFSERYQERVLGVPVTLTGILLFALFVLWAIRLFQKTAKVRFFPGVTIPFAMLVILSGLSFLWAAKAHCVASGFPLVLQAFFLFFYAANFLRPGEDIRFLINCLAVTVAITGMLGISQ